MAGQDPLGDAMKVHERSAQGAPFSARTPLYARLDGRAFSRFTRDMERPCDPRLLAAMQRTARDLMLQVDAQAAYVQSDEISLLWADSDTPGREPFFGGKPFKVVSVLAGLGTALFARALDDDPDGLGAWRERLPHFDARACPMPDRETAAQMIAWRSRDAARNAVHMVARSRFSHKRLQGASLARLREMLRTAGLCMSAFPDAFRNGTLLVRRRQLRGLTPEELARIPERHRPAPGAHVLRSAVEMTTATPPHRLDDLEAVLFDGQADAAHAA